MERMTVSKMSRQLVWTVRRHRTAWRLVSRRQLVVRTPWRQGVARASHLLSCWPVGMTAPQT
jgi:hypothetical protein